MAHQITDEMRRCIDECQSCREICLETVTHCLAIGGKHAEDKHIRTLLDCVDICTSSADFMLRTSDQHPRLCGVCAEVCARSAETCDRVGPDDDLMRRCAEECRRCADVCRAMSVTKAAASRA